jgi:hypothetical protein
MKCKVCACDEERRTMIENRLRIGDSVNDIAADLRSFGIEISGTSVLRHKNNHMPEYQREGNEPLKPKYSESDVKGEPLTIDVAEVLAEIEEELTNHDYQESATIERLKTQILLERICQNQLVIVEQLQNRYVQAKGAYPNDQIRGLKIILEMISGLPAYNNTQIKAGLDKISNEVRMKQEFKRGFDATTEHAKTYTPGFIFKDEYLPLTNPHPSAIGVYQEPNPKWIKWNEGKAAWLKANPAHRFATDFEVFEYITRTCQELGDSDAHKKHMAQAGKQKRPTLEWVKTLPYFVNFEKGITET